MKKVLIDIYKINKLNSGLGNFSFNFMKNILNQGFFIDNNVKFLIDKNSNYLFEDKSKLEYTNIIKRYYPLINESYDIWHSTQQFPSFLPNKKTKKWIFTIHDLNFLTEKSGRKQEKYYNKLKKYLIDADVITSISEFTKNEIITNFPKFNNEIKVIHNGVNFMKNTSSVKPKLLSENEKFVFSIGIFNEKKNFDKIISALKMQDKYKIVIAGNNNTEYGNKIKKIINSENLNNKIILLGEILEEEKKWCYQNCKAFIFPSIAEGFGIPIIEALSFGKIVFASNYCSLPEIADKYAYYFNNFEPNYMRKFILNNIENELFDSNVLISYAKKYNWNNCINNYIKLYDL